MLRKDGCKYVRTDGPTDMAIYKAGFAWKKPMELSYTLICRLKNCVYHLMRSKIVEKWIQENTSGRLREPLAYVAKVQVQRSDFLDLKINIRDLLSRVHGGSSTKYMKSRWPES